MPQVANKVVVVGKDIFIFHTEHYSKNYNYFISKYERLPQMCGMLSPQERKLLL